MKRYELYILISPEWVLCGCHTRARSNDLSREYRTLPYWELGANVIVNFVLHFCLILDSRTGLNALESILTLFEVEAQQGN